jgi:transcription termination factor Rho
LVVTRKLRRALDSRDSLQSIEVLLDGLRKSRTNIEFLTQLDR